MSFEDERGLREYDELESNANTGFISRVLRGIEIGLGVTGGYLALKHLAEYGPTLENTLGSLIVLGAILFLEQTVQRVTEEARLLFHEDGVVED